MMILVDAHVHIYDCFDLQHFLDSAVKNFKAEAARWGQEDDFTALLLLTETAKENWFHRLAGYAGSRSGNGTESIGNWTFHRTNEDHSLYAQSEKSQGFFLIAGRQIVTAEDLEVLALMTDRQFEDGRPLEEVIQAVKETSAIPVIPWGFGKWMGKRGAILENILRKGKDSILFLGDNSGRPVFLPRPSLFEFAEKKGIRVLPGSDSLPFLSESQRVGCFGLSIHGTISREHPARDLKRIFLDPKTRFQAYGNLENPYRFFRNQLTAQIVKWRYKQEWM
jgi:hypothetical protein